MGESITKEEIARATFHELMTDPNHLAVSASDLVAEMAKNGVEANKSSAERFFRKAYEKGLIEYKITHKGKCYRYCGTNNPFPPLYEELIFNAVKEINNETGRPATTTQVIERINHVLDRDAVNTKLKRMVYKEGTLRFVGNFSRIGMHAYVINSDEFNYVMQGIRKKDIHEPVKKTMESIVVEKYGGYLKSDLSLAKSKTHVGDEFDVFVSKKGLHNEEHDPEKLHLKVTMLEPHICVFENGMSLPWIDFAALYKNGKRLETTTY